MAWTVEVKPEALRQIKRLDAGARRLVMRYIDERIAASDDPRAFGHALVGDLKGLWRYRVGDLRLICSIEDEQLLVLLVKVGHRREVYD